MNKMQNVKWEFDEDYRLTNDQLSRAHETSENQELEFSNYVSQVEELEETILDLHNKIGNLKSVPNSNSSEEYINQLQSNNLELQDANTSLSGEVKCLFYISFKKTYCVCLFKGAVMHII